MLSEESIAEFASQPFIQQCLRNPESPESVLSFIFGVEYRDTPEFDRMLRQGHAVIERKPFWFGRHSDFDALCQPFRGAVRASGKGRLMAPEWTATIDGVLAQLLLCDQLSRSIFRGSDEAFVYDDQSLVFARRLSSSIAGIDSNAEVPLRGTFHIPYVVFLLTAFMHSERIDDHRSLAHLLDYADEHAPAILHDWFRLMRSGGEAHTRVIERFGRYPHRNAAKGRSTSAQEAAWLADIDNLPSWAKSQLPSK